MSNITTQTIRVDLSTDKVIPSAFTHQNDTARTLEFSMYNKGVPYDMTGNTVKFAYKSPIVNGQYSVIAGASMASGTVSGNKVTVTLPSAYTAISGVGMLTMIITPTSGTVRPVNIRLVVQKSADGPDSVSGASDFPATLESITNAWMEENLIPTIDDTLTLADKAADAEVVGSILGVSSYDIADSSLWVRESIYGGERISATKYIALVDFLPKTISHIHVDGTYKALLYRYTATGDYVGYWNGSDFVTAGASVWRTDFDVPQDEYRYIITLHENSDADITTSASSVVTASTFVPVNILKRLERLEARKRTGFTANWWLNGYCIGANSFDDNGSYQGNVWSASADLAITGFIDITGAKMLDLPMIRTTETTQPQYGMCFYNSSYQPIVGKACGCFYGRTSGQAMQEKVLLYVPEDAKYFRTTYWSSSVSGAEDFSYDLYYYYPDNCKPITHELPVSVGMQNAIRRARQLTDIKWTPKVNIPRYSMMNGGSKHFLDWFYADKEYVGIPYSGCGGGESNWTTPKEWGYAHNWVGGCIPFDAFVTAARYPNSIFSETVDQSTYNYDSSPFGIVCTALVNYAVNGSWPLRGIQNFFDTSDHSFINTHKTVETMPANGFAIGDFLYTVEHVIIITDIMRDVDGNVTHVEMSEATTIGNGNNTELGTQYGGVARRKMWDVNEFKSIYTAYAVYRRSSFNGIPYTPSKYVDTGDEGNMTNIVDLPCIPYLGNKAVYKAGYIHNSKVLIGATGYSTLVVKKDGEEFGTFSISGVTEVEVGFSAAGEYSAYLQNSSSDKTMSCTWTVSA